MHLDGRRIPDGSDLRADTCVVGSGPAGLTVAALLARAGHEVILLESAAPREEAAFQALNAGRVEGDPYDGLEATRARGVGGTAHRWNTAVGGGDVMARYLPLNETDLEGWPLSLADLTPWYAEALRLAGAGPMRIDAGAWAPQVPLARRMAAAGLEPSVYRVGPQDVWTGEIPREIRASGSARLVDHATAVWIRYADGGRAVAALEAGTLEGSRFTVQARRFVLAAGAVENARLLLASVQEGSRAPGNAGGWLGAGFMEHPRDFGMWLEPAGGLAPSELHWCDAQHARDGASLIGHLAASPAARRDAGLPALGVSLLPRRVPGPVGRLLGAGKQPGYGWSRRRVHLPWRGYRLVVNLEQRPDRANAVALDAPLDRFGVPRPVLRWRWRPEEQEGLERARQWLAGALADAGLGTLHWTRGARPDPNAHHHAGTTRMAASLVDGVVDADCRVHGVGNLYVAGASVFPTAGYANPVLTIVALAARLAERLGGSAAGRLGG